MSLQSAITSDIGHQPAAKTRQRTSMSPTQAEPLPLMVQHFLRQKAKSSSMQVSEKPDPKYHDDLAQIGGWAKANRTCSWQVTGRALVVGQNDSGAVTAEYAADFSNGEAAGGRSDDPLQDSVSFKSNGGGQNNPIGWDWAKTVAVAVAAYEKLTAFLRISMTGVSGGPPERFPLSLWPCASPQTPLACLQHSRLLVYKALTSTANAPGLPRIFLRIPCSFAPLINWRRSFMKWLVSILIGITAVFLTYNTLATKAFLQPAKSILTSVTRATSQSSTSSFAGLPLIPSHLVSTSSSNMTTPRGIKFSFLAREQSEGAGATVRRSVGTPQLRHLTPFLMLDHFHVPPGAGFPDHPHRGQETITYLLRGGIDHEDFAGNKGTIGPGDLQFMTAGRGIMHAEMPAQNHDLNVGMQLWVDLPKDLKSCEPRYRDLKAEEIPKLEIDDGKVEVKVISGRSHGVDSVKDLAYTPVWLLDITVRPGGKIEQELPKGWNAFAYTLSGAVTFSNGSEAGETITPYHNVVFEQAGDLVTASVEEGSSEEARFILVAGQPLDQPIVQYGPFVTVSKEEVYKAMMDFQTHSNGFERAEGWESQIGKSMGRVR